MAKGRAVIALSRCCHSDVGLYARRNQLFSRWGVLRGMRASTQETCPSCGYGAGLYLVPRDARTADTPVRCLSCRHEAPIEEWLREALPVRASSMKRGARQ